MINHTSLYSLRYRPISIGVPIINLRRSLDRFLVDNGDSYIRKTCVEAHYAISYPPNPTPSPLITTFRSSILSFQTFGISQYIAES